MVKAKIILDESKYANGLNDEWRWYFCFSDASLDFITVTDSKDPVLIAVTKNQFKAWDNQLIIAIKRSLLSLYWAKILRSFR